MTYFDVQPPIGKTWPAIAAGAALLFAGALSVTGLNLFGVQFGFGFIPLLVLAIWPRRANGILSIVLVFFAGLFTDWAAGGIIGQSALLFVLIWGVLRPELRSSPFSPINMIVIWLATCGLAVVVLSVSGVFVMGIAPDLTAMARQMILASCLLPVLMLLRKVISMRLTDYDDWG